MTEPTNEPGETGRPPPSEFSEIVRRAAHGDGEARSQLFDRVAREGREAAQLLAMARRLLPRGDRAREFLESRDLIQSALRTGWLDLTQFHGRTPGEFLAWIRTILRNKLSHAVRRQRPEVREQADLPDRPSSETAVDPLAVMMRDEVRDRVRSAVERLPKDQRVVLDMRLSGLTAPEIAERLGLNADAVRKRESRAAERLREALGDR